MKPTNEQNFLIEITPALHDRIKQELGDAYIDNYVLHYSPYWKEMKHVDAGVSVTPEENLIQERLKTYDQYWNEETQKYHVEADWIVTKDELIEDLKRAYKFEHGGEKS